MTVLRGLLIALSVAMCNAKLLANAKQLFLLSFFYFLLLGLLCYGVRELVKNSNAPFLRSLLVDEERMMPGHWLALVL